MERGTCERCPNSTEGSKYARFCSFRCYQRDYRERKRAERVTAAPTFEVGVVFLDLHRNVGVGPFGSEEEGMDFMVSQGHMPSDLRCIDVVSPTVWAETGEM